MAGQRSHARPLELLMFGGFLLILLFLWISHEEDRRIALPPKQHKLLQEILDHMEQQGKYEDKLRTKDENTRTEDVIARSKDDIPRNKDVNAREVNVKDASSVNTETYHDEPTTVVLTGYVRSPHACLYADKSLSHLESKPCTPDNLPAEKERMLFKWSSHGHMMVMGKCVTHYEKKVILEYCYDNNPYQVWTQPNSNNFILTSFYTCLTMHVRPNTVGTRMLKSDDCWNQCLSSKFDLVTWFVVDSPGASPDPSVVAALTEKEQQPWQQRYCVPVIETAGQYAKHKKALDAKKGNSTTTTKNPI